MFPGLPKNNLGKVLALFIFLFLFFCRIQVAQAASMYFSPSSKNVNVGDIIKVSVLLNTESEAVNNAEANINFPSDKLEIVSITKGSVFSLWVEEPSFSNGVGTASFNGGIPTPGYEGSGGNLVSITFRAKKSGTASIYFASGAVRANDGLGTNVLRGLGQAQFTLVDKAAAPTETTPPKETPPSTETKPESTNVASPVVSTNYTVSLFDLNISIYNPAKVRQKFSYQVFLPKELKLENIIDKGGFTIQYNEQKQALSASLELNLEAGATVKRVIRMQNVWYMSEDELNAIKNQANEYYDKLEQSQYFPQALILKNDLDTRIDKIISSQRDNINSADDLINVYQDNRASLALAKKDLDDLKNLLDRTGPANNFLGSSSGIKTTTANNIIIALGINFILLVAILIYIWKQQKNIKKQLVASSVTTGQKPIAKTNRSVLDLKKGRSISVKLRPNVRLDVNQLSGKIRGYFVGLLALLFILILAICYWLFSYYSLPSTERSLNKLSNQAELVDKSNNQAIADSSTIDSSGEVQASSTLAIREAETNNQVINHYYVLITKTPAGWLNVRDNPSKAATVINQVHDGDKLEVSATKSTQNNDQYAWYQIIWPDNKAGWVYGQYVKEVSD